jgi:oligo-1,6-glucosidase
MIMENNLERKWWKESVVYQIYPRSFYDSNGDGIGDLQGIIQKLDYIKSLCVDVIWLNPVYQSPNDDNGYDISNYFEIMADFGTMDDWEELLAKVHSRGLRLIMDLVINHTSDEHEWFVEAKSSKDSEYRDYYIWHDAVNGRRPNDWVAHFSGSVWEWEPDTKQYYLHLFTRKQPDLNWENSRVREDIFEMMRWWLDKGIDGFRMDTINMLSKTPGFPPVGDPEDGELRYAGKYFNNGPKIHDYLREMNKKVLSRYDIMTVGECPDVTPETAMKYTAPERKEMNMLFHFEHMSIDHSHDDKWNISSFDLVKFKKIISKWQIEFHGKGWNSNYLMNHDQPRAVSRFGDDGKYRKESAKMLLTLLLTLEGTPYIYQGEEIGMPNSGLSNIDDYRDVEVMNHYREAVEAELDLEAVMASYMKMSRDNARTPMQWSSGKNAGFTVGQPWIKPGVSSREVNVEKDLADPESIIKYLRALTVLRKENPVLIYGEYESALAEDSRLYLYRRSLSGDKFLVMLNFSGDEVALYNDESFSLDEADAGELLICNYPVSTGGSLKVLRPFEARVYK